MKLTRLLGLILAATLSICGTAFAAATEPNILPIMGDDIGGMQPSVYHRGWIVGETPNIDRIANEGALFMDYLAEQSCTAGRNDFKICNERLGCCQVVQGGQQRV